MKKHKILIYGSGGHSKVVLSAINTNDYIIKGFFDSLKSENEIFTIKNFGIYDKNIIPEASVVIAIGDNNTRIKISKIISHNFISVIHNSSIIDSSVCIGEGSMILHGTIIQRDSVIGKHVIINTKASVDHDSIISDYVHIAPNVTVLGNVKIGRGSLVGASSTILPGVKIGENVIIGAGSVVVNDIPDNSIVKGIPAK
jgi:sugar O-acyltransferase (sialic acid O-acetyltransferase NeuD family)